MPRAARAPHSSKIPRRMSALRQPRPHAPRHAQEETGDRAAVALRLVQAHLHAGPGERSATRPIPCARCSMHSRPTASATRWRKRRRASDQRAAARSAHRPSRAGSTQHKAHMSYLRLRERGRHLFPPAQTIRSIKLYHRQIYGYAFHRSKLELLRRGELDDKRGGDTRFAPLANFLEAVPLICPHDLVPRRRARPCIASASRVRRHLAHHRQSQRERRDAHRRASSFRPSATTSCVTRRCSASCSRTTA